MKHQVGRASVAALGQQMTGPALSKPKIKRAWCFCANQRVIVANGVRGVIERRSRRRGEPLPVTLDRVELRAFHSLMAVAVGGRPALQHRLSARFSCVPRCGWLG
jgi:hypothetical protein